MMTAIFYFRGGSLQGPAGTGKTETIKDLSRTLAKYVIVFNCSNKNSYNTMATLFLGIINTGAWVCFDEFNRIEIEVLSVIRIQLVQIFDALRAKLTSIPFKGNAGVRINHSLAIFITMNPQYIFRSELPDNLKILFRPVALKAADRQRICEIRFLADGNGAQIANNLAKFLIVSLDVLDQQLSKQPHYDFSLRAIMSILKHYSSLKNLPGHDETFTLRMAISDMLKPKLIYEDEDVFENALSSVFNDGLQGDGTNINEQIYQASLIKEENLRNEIKQIIDIKKLTGSPFLVNQVVQLHNNMLLKHGLMLVGDSLSGKTTTLKLLQALNKRKASSNQNKNTDFTDVEIRTIFPKSIELDELYGKTGNDGQYHDGLLPYHLKDISNTRYDDGTQRIIKWLVLDAPVDTLWIESLNTLLDDTRMLSLPSGFRINLKQDIKIVFEAESLTQATPATISRVGLIYFESQRLTWFPIARKWLDEHKSNKDWYDNIAKWFDKYVYPMLEE
jgi:dynein heavy chain